MMQISGHSEALRNLAIVVHNVRLWSGQKKLRTEDIVLGAGGALPPEEVASLGHKKIIGSEAVNWGPKYKQRMARACAEQGTRFLGGYAVPLTAVSALRAELDKIVDEARNKKAIFLTEYHDLVEQHIQKYPDWEQALRRAITPIHYVDQAFHFSYSVFTIDPMASGSGDLEQEVAGLGDSALKEISVEARKLLQESIEGKGEISRKAVNPIERIRNKLNGLSFLDASFRPMVDAIDGVLNQVGTKGPIPDDAVPEFVAMVQLLSYPEEVRNHGKGLVTIRSMVQQIRGTTPSVATDPGLMEAPSLPLVTTKERPSSVPADPAGAEIADLFF